MQRNSNKLVAQHLQAAGGYAQRQWALIAIFYAALHSAQAALITTHAEDPGSHRDRKAALKKYYRGNPGYRGYYRLHKRASSVRYTGYVPPDLSQDWADLQAVEQHIV